MVLVAGGVLADLTYTATTELLTEAGWRLAAPLPAPAIMPGLGLGNRVLLLGNLTTNHTPHTCPLHRPAQAAMTATPTWTWCWSTRRGRGRGRGRGGRRGGCGRGGCSTQ